MLPERGRELLTAYVDGELSARQRRHVLRLLRHSAEARRLLQRLQGDAAPAPHPPTDGVAEQTPPDAAPPTAPDKDEPSFTSEKMEVFQLQSVTPSADVPTTFAMHDLVEKNLLAELQKDALHVELPV